MEIAVTTPTGNVGSFVVRNLVRLGRRPRVLTRDPGTLDGRLRGHVDARAVDLADADAVLEETKGVDALYLVLPPTEADDPIAEFGRIGRDVTAAIVANGIARTVFQSSGGAELRQGAGEIDGLAATEVALDEAGVSVTHLRNGFFYTNLLHQLDALRAGVVPVLWPTDQPMPWVAPRDIADVATGLLLSSDWSGRRVQGVHGPRDLSWDDAMAAVSAAVGRQIRAERIPDDQMRAALASFGMGAAQVESIVRMAIGLRDGFVPEQQREVTTTTETTLEAWAYDVLRPALAAT